MSLKEAKFCFAIFSAKFMSCEFVQLLFCPGKKSETRLFFVLENQECNVIEKNSSNERKLKLKVINSNEKIDDKISNIGANNNDDSVQCAN